MENTKTYENVYDRFGEEPRSSYNMVTAYRWDGLRLFRGFSFLILFGVWLWALVSVTARSFLQLSSWVHILAILYFLGVSYFHFLDTDIELLNQSSKDKRFVSAVVVRALFEISLPISIVVMLVYWFTEFPSESVTGVGQELVISVFTHFVVFVLLFVDYVFNRILFNGTSLGALVGLLIVFGLINSIYIANTGNSREDTLMAFMLIIVWSVLAYLLMSYFAVKKEELLSEGMKSSVPENQPLMDDEQTERDPEIILDEDDGLEGKDVPA